MSTAHAAYLAAHFGKSLFWYVNEIMLTYLLIDVLHVESGWIKVILPLCLLAGAGSGLLFSALAGAWLNSVKSLQRLQLTGSILCSLCFGLILWAGRDHPLMLAGALVVFQSSYSVYDLAQNAVLTLGARDLAQRSRLSSWRLACSGSASILISLSLFPMGHATGWMSPVLWMRVFGAAICLAAVASAIAFWRVAYPSALERASSDAQAPARRRLGITIGLMVVNSVCGPIFTRLTPEMYRFHDAPVLDPQTQLLTYSLGLIAIQAVKPLWIGTLSFRAHLRLSGGLLLAAAACAPLMWMASLSITRWCFALETFFYGMVCGMIGTITWARFADAVSGFGGRQVSMAYAAFVGVAKVTLALVGWGVTAMVETVASNAQIVAGLIVAAAACCGLCIAAMGELWGDARA